MVGSSVNKSFVTRCEPGSLPTLCSSWTARIGSATTQSLTPGLKRKMEFMGIDNGDVYQPQGWVESGGGGQAGSGLQVQFSFCHQCQHMSRPVTLMEARVLPWPAGWTSWTLWITRW